MSLEFQDREEVEGESTRRNRNIQPMAIIFPNPDNASVSSIATSAISLPISSIASSADVFEDPQYDLNLTLTFFDLTPVHDKMARQPIRLGKKFKKTVESLQEKFNKFSQS